MQRNRKAMRGSDEKKGVSVVIPTYYRNDLLKEAIQSVQAQAYEEVEVIVVDDSGEAYARPAIRDYSVQYVPLEENEGPQTARTIGIEQTSGRFVQLLDDDDRLRPNKFRNQVDILKQNDNAGVVYSGFSWADGSTVLPKRDVRGNVLDRTLMFDTAPCITSTMLIERKVLERILPLKRRPGADDAAIKIELARLTEFEYVDESLVFRTESASSRQNSAGKVRGQREILNEYRDLYDDFPADVYRTALAETYLVESMQILEEVPWSLEAILTSWKAFYHSPNKSGPYIGAFVASLFGRPGRDAALSLFRLLRGQDYRGKAT